MWIPSQLLAYICNTQPLYSLSDVLLCTKLQLIIVSDSMTRGIGYAAD